MTNVRSLLPAVLLILFGADALVAQARAPGVLQNAWTSPCTLDVVLVTFRDTTGMHMGGTVQADTFRTYSDYDLPHGYSVNSDGALDAGGFQLQDGGLPPSVRRGRLRLFRQRGTGPPTGVFRGGHRSRRRPDGEVAGGLRQPAALLPRHLRRPVRAARAHPQRGRQRRVPRLGSSCRRPRAITRTGPQPSPQPEKTSTWIHAYNATLDSVRAWYPGTTAYDPPDVGYSRERRLRHKVLYLYAGPSYSDPRLPRGLQSRIHPQADRITAPNPTTTPTARRVPLRGL